MADSFLSAQGFPADKNSVSFSDRMQLLEESYQPYQSEYDPETGMCIRNCTYVGLTLKQEMEISDADTADALAASAEFEIQNKQLSVDTRNIVSAMGAYACLNRNPNILTGQKVPRNEPLLGFPQITSPYGPRVLSGKQGFHDGIDYSAVIGTIVYAPADGRVVNVWSDSRCGNGVKLEHEDGTKTLYCHLNNALVKKGDVVGAGCPIAQTGNSGHTTGPHLHYAMQNSAGRKIDPSDYTKRDR